jgi:hypothetical protein
MNRTDFTIHPRELRGGRDTKTQRFMGWYCVGERLSLQAGTLRSRTLT